MHFTVGNVQLKFWSQTEETECDSDRSESTWQTEGLWARFGPCSSFIWPKINVLKCIKAALPVVFYFDWKPITDFTNLQ